MATETRDATALERLMREGSDADVRRLLGLLTPPEMADLIEALRRPEDRSRAVRAMLGRDRSEVVRNLEEGPRAEVLEDLSDEETAAVISDLQSDDAVDVLQELDEDRQEAVLSHIEPEDRADLQRFLEYPEDTAGGLMQAELVAVRETWTVDQAIEEIRRTRNEVGELHDIYVVDANQILLGSISERMLLLADGKTPVKGLFNPLAIKVPLTMDQEDVAGLVQDYDRTAVPVVAEDGRLVGRILIDDVLDVIEEEATEDIARLAGTSPDEIYDTSAWSSLRARSPWLLITFLGGIAAAHIMRLGESAIHEAGILYAFIPVIMGMGGGSSTQAATVTVRSLALGRITAGGVLKVVLREMVVGVVLAVASAALLFAVVAMTADGELGIRIATIAGIAILGTMALGVLFGVLTPLILERMGADPAVATSPFVTTVNDLLGSTLILVSVYWIL